MAVYQNLGPQERLAYRKKREICRKLTALESEFDSWLALSKPNEPFEKHHTQLRAVQAFLAQWNKTVRELIHADLLSNSEEFLASMANAQRLMLSEYRIWEYFRSKFVQRNEPIYKEYLDVADEFAWSCYRPVQETIYSNHLDANRKEPPLVFFNGGASPFSLSRGKKFQPEAVANEPPSEKEIELSKLPIPVVGIPWNQINYLPDAVVIGHEVGHIVEDDFGLTEPLKALLQEAITDAGADARKDAWEKWLGEIFADIYGCLATGPSFVGGLLDFLARDSADISLETKTSKDWGDYPTIYLRGKLVLETLEQMGFAKEAMDFRELWKGFSSKMDAGYDYDIPFIVTKLLRGKSITSHNSKVPDKSIADVFIFAEADLEDVDDTLDRLQKGLPLGSSKVRVLIASVRRAYEKEPKEFQRKGYEDTVLEYINTHIIKAGVRDLEIPLTEEELKQKVKGYEALAQQLINQVLR